jgi:hypothetical protein
VTRALVLATLAMATFNQAAASTVELMSIERLTRASTLIVQARALESWSAWEGNQIFTYTRFQVDQALKGPAQTSVVVRQMGGRADGYTMKVAGVRHWRAGEDAVLFLRPSRKKPGAMVVTGLMQGNFRIMREPSGERYVSNGITGVKAFERERGVIHEYEGRRMTLHELETRVRKVMRQEQ